MIFKRIILLCLISQSLSSQIKFDDKAAHWWVAFGLTVVSSEITYQITDRIGLSVLAGGIVGEGATLGKELFWDGHLKKGVKSLEDGIVGSMGTVSGMMIATVKFNIQSEKRNKRNKSKLRTLL